MGNLCPAFRQRGERWRDFPISAVSQLLLAQNNQYTKVAYFGAACPKLLQPLLQMIVNCANLEALW